MFDSNKHFGNADHWVSRLVSRYIGNIDECTSAQLADPKKPGNPGVESELEKANVITSKNQVGGNHLLLDIDDYDVYLKPSTTVGHYHIGFSQTIDDDDFDKLVTLLHKVGIIKEGNFRSYKKIGWFALRTPWVRKGETQSLSEAGVIGNSDFNSPQEALENLQKTCKYLGVEFPNEIYQQLNAKLVTEALDFNVPDDVQF